MATDYTYGRKDPAFDPEKMRGATGLPVVATLPNPTQIVVVSMEKPLDPKELEPLDIYMGDFGYERITP